MTKSNQTIIPIEAQPQSPIMCERVRFTPELVTSGADLAGDGTTYALMFFDTPTLLHQASLLCIEPLTQNSGRVRLVRWNGSTSSLEEFSGGNTDTVSELVDVGGVNDDQIRREFTLSETGVPSGDTIRFETGDALLIEFTNAGGAAITIDEYTEILFNFRLSERE